MKERPTLYGLDIESVIGYPTEEKRRCHVCDKNRKNKKIIDIISQGNIN
jgi:hypothetical protein